MKSLFQNFLLLVSSTLIIFILLEIFLYFEHKSPNYKRYKLKLSDINLTFNDDPEAFFNSKIKNNAIFLGDSFTVNEVCAGTKKDFVNLIKKNNKTEDIFYNFGSLGITSTDMVNIYNYLKKGKLSKLIIVLYALVSSAPLRVLNRIWRKPMGIETPCKCVFLHFGPPGRPQNLIFFMFSKSCRSFCTILAPRGSPKCSKTAPEVDF